MQNLSARSWLLALPLSLACSSSTEPPSTGTPGSGGAAAAQGGVSGTSSSGGAPSFGGTSVASGGAAFSGGSASVTGGSGSGGAAGSEAGATSGGALALGGSTNNGGSAGFGGGSAAGSGAGGAAGNGAATNGGQATSGGVGGVGGNLGRGGAFAGGTNSGGASSAGASSAGAAGSAGPVGACATNQLSSCTGTNPIECHFGGNPGDYQVTVDLGGPSAGDSLIEVESFRRVLAPVTTTAGQTQRFTFFVNVREPEGQPIQDVPAGTPGLDVYIRGTAPKLSAICYQAKKPAPKLWIAGDSTVCDQDGTDYAGWGQHLPQFIVPPVSVANYSDSGESSGSFLGSGKLWGAIKAGWVAGDWVLIQFGHNDKDVTASAFQANLSSMLSQAKSAGVNAVLITPISRVGYALADEHINSTGANLPQIVRDLGKSQNVPVIDLTVTTWNWLQTVDWKQYFALGTDHTHTNPKGAGVIAGFVRDALRDQKIPLSAYLR